MIDFFTIVRIFGEIHDMSEEELEQLENAIAFRRATLAMEEANVST